jgi:hypothetical protein
MSFGAAVMAASVMQSILQRKAVERQQWVVRDNVIISNNPHNSVIFGSKSICEYCRQHSPGTTCKQCGAPRD